MKVLVACEFSGIVREAFKARGHDAWSCDILTTEIPRQHIQCDVRDILRDGWDLMIAHPPCTYLARSGQRTWHKYTNEQIQAILFVDTLFKAPVPRIAIENPRGILSYRTATGRVWRAYDTIIQPWQFGHSESKATCLWLKNLPPLMHTLIVTERNHHIHDMGPHPDRQKNRSRTFQGIADAMADQWGFEKAAQNV